MRSENKWCADTILAMAIPLLADEWKVSPEDALLRIAGTAAYSALYDEETKLWGTGPVYYANFVKLCMRDGKGDSVS